jgi:ADP-ribose pyrophosphatase YjhB (NUDIX family)
VAVHAGRLLLVQRARAPQAGRWTVPGGRVEPGEAVAAAVEREVREETGLAVRCGPLLGWAERIGPGHHFVILDFVVDVGPSAGDPVAGDDAAAAAWVLLDAVPAVDLVDGLEEFLRSHGVL